MEAFDEDEWLEHLEEHLKRNRKIFLEKMKELWRHVLRNIEGKFMNVL